jgi:hypothetical protein
MKHLIVVLFAACLMTACNTSLPEPLARSYQWSLPSSTAVFKGWNPETISPQYTLDRIKDCVPDINHVCPPRPRGISYKVAVIQLPYKVVQYAEGNGSWLPKESFVAEKVAITESVTLDLSGVDALTLKELNSSEIEVFPAQYDHETDVLWYYLTPQ